MPQVRPLNWVFVLFCVFFLLIVRLAKLRDIRVRPKFEGGSVLRVWKRKVVPWGLKG